ncbi:hypothetical protein PHYBOEH_001852 [Phytophthora boehmeriae]|uniref:Uncharacterized protein n=1 Tax=Phytophthora boehmeriae TaxID=109152 RepID=A0A8T1WWY2_9STRA|nr:hypothetical protein PHYBOEH_001852 [Phytophthora boehmeriae]
MSNAFGYRFGYAHFKSMTGASTNWWTRAVSGDSASALVQPHQVLVSHGDARLHGLAQLDLVYVHFEAQPTVVLECVVVRPPSAAAGRIQVHPWVLETCGQLEDAQATVEVLGRSASAVDPVKWRLTLSLQRKIPLVATSGRGNSERSFSSARVDLLPESARQKQIDLEAAIRRQLRAAGTLSAPKEGQLVPVRLLGGTYVFRIDGVVGQVEGTEKSVIVVTGWRDEASSATIEELSEQVAALSFQTTTDAAKSEVRNCLMEGWSKNKSALMEYLSRVHTELGSLWLC